MLTAFASPTDAADAVEVEAITPDADCYWLRKVLSPAEQACFFEFIREHDRTDWDNMPPCMNPTPKTLQFARPDDGGPPTAPTLAFDGWMTTVASEAVGRVGEILLRRRLLPLSGLPATAPTSISLAAIRYPSPDGRFPRHVDHCNDGSFVFLFSLGCRARFRVSARDAENVREFELQSGDALVFDPSSAAGIAHEVCGIGEAETCPAGLGERFAELRRFRYGVQCRVRF